MARGIIIFGSAGSGKTALGRAVAERLGYPYFDIDDYIWRKDTAIPFTSMYAREEKAERLMHAITPTDHFVMAGSMDSFNAPFVPLFDLAAHINADATIRQARLHQREWRIYGERILKGGDMYEEHQRFLDSAARYDADGSPCLKTHLEWASSLPCKVIYLNGEENMDINAERIIKEYFTVITSKI